MVFLGFVAAISLWGDGEELSASDRDWFEARVRPLLVERCYRCHNSVDTAKARLALDHREGLLRGGRSGPALVPGDPNASLLLRSVRHETGVEPMPRDEPTLEPHELDDLAEWIRRGAPDPRSRVPTAEDYDAETSWEAVRARRSAWWSFRPLTEVSPPKVSDESWIQQPLDRFILGPLEADGVTPSPPADPETLLRRVSLVLTGLPPTLEAQEAFSLECVSVGSDAAYATVVDRLLQSAAYAERWARHWMDLVRYAESHGAEGDPEIPQAYQYRDALIRAFAADVPYDQLVREHLAGDQVGPRVDAATGVDDAAVMLAHFRFVQHGYAPTDVLDEQVRFTDNQIDVVTKAFLGLTVSCARCHDHKFDPISQRDYFALYGAFVSDQPALRNVDGPARQRRHVPELQTLKSEIRQQLADAFTASLDSLPERLHALPVEVAGARGDLSPLTPWLRLREALDVGSGWREMEARVDASRKALRDRRATARWSWSASDGGPLQWHAHGNTVTNSPRPAGWFTVPADGERAIDGIFPSAFASHALSTKHSGLLTSSRFLVDSPELWIRASGNVARARYAMQHYPRVAGPPYKSHGLSGTDPRWLRWDMTYWEGDQAYLELATARDIPVEARGETRSWWMLSDVVAGSAGMGPPRDEPAEWLAPLFDVEGAPPATHGQLVERYRATLRQVIERWRSDRMSDADARFLDAFVQADLVPTRLDALPTVAPRVERWRELERDVPVPTRAPGVVPGDRIEQPLFTRGDHRNPEEAVPHRFLELFDETPYGDGVHSRRRLADDVVETPLASRVAVNRVWHWVFGRGLVATVDNVGRLGATPSHPELLDWLARQFVHDGWSVRRLLRRLVLSSTFRQASQRREDLPPAFDADRAWARMPVRRLDAESIRDSILQVSGRLDRGMGGPSVSEESSRRSVYVRARRNDLPPFLGAFDAPDPYSTTGARSITNVPAQALAMMNAPLVVESANAWAGRVLGWPDATTEALRIERMLREGLGRAPRVVEVEAARSYLEDVRAAGREAAQQSARRTAEIAELEARRSLLLENGRERVRATRDPAQEAPLLPQPFARWEFESGLFDEVGSLHGEAVGTARAEGGRLVLDGAGHVVTNALGVDVRAKTLEAWLVLNDVDQRGSGVLSVQSNDGERFDAIVLGERRVRRWIAGSDHFRRTQDVDGMDEVAGELTYVAITYADDGTIRLYRNGHPYGAPYRTAVAEYKAAEAVVLIGARHGVGGSPKGRLRAEIERVQLHTRALTDEEIAATATGDPHFVPQHAAVAALDEAERQELSAAERRLEQLRAEVRAHPVPAGGHEAPERAWSALAHALFSLKEFVNLR